MDSRTWPVLLGTALLAAARVSNAASSPAAATAPAAESPARTAAAAAAAERGTRIDRVIAVVNDGVVLESELST